MTSHKHGLAQNGGLRSRSFKTNFFMLAGTSEAETPMRVKVECLLAIGEEKKRKLSGATSFKENFTLLVQQDYIEPNQLKGTGFN